MSETGEAPSAAVKRMRLRYAGTCRECGAALPAGETAVYERESKTVVCLACGDAPAPAPQGATAAAEQGAGQAGTGAQGIGPTELERVVAGSAGASAQREYERRRAKREDRVRTAHPRIGGFLLAISDEPQSTNSWATGARGEALLGKGLDGLAGRGVRVLHDRRIPRTKANIDHIAVSAAGVFVIDAKRYKGRPHLRVVGGLFRPRVEMLVVGTRDQTKLVQGVHKQVDLVHGALEAAGLADVPVRGVLCFVEADWPLFGGSFVIDGVGVLWPKKLAEQLATPGALDDAMTERVHRALAIAFPLA
ncbi:nuclease-related domain-containing protein [Cellulomonas sp. KRMCY2]|uniref:nuclease-related domain-containing protein n=1 Tax=Cellulomonas sp. KRMCY2 TaxID=1304865 RepID=UPI001E635808|nr:nuclease-related domain-containing protein [Cellulomonas sp. KRMCY2]